MKGPKLVCVIWDDAYGSATKLYIKERDHGPIQMVTVGWLLEHDKVGLSIANERFAEDGQYVYRGHTFIPAGIVRQVKALR